MDPQGAEHRRNSASRARYLNALKLGKLEQIVEKYVLGANEILNISDVIRGWNRVPDNTSLQTPSGVMEVEVDNRKYWLTEQKWKAIGTSLLSHLKQWHLVHPNEKGVTPALLEGACELGTARVLFLPALKELTRNREIVLSEGLLCTSDQQARLKTTDSAEWRKLQAMLAGAGKKIPSLPQLEEGGQFKPGELRKIIATGVREKRLLKISEKRVALPETLKVFVTVLAALDAEGTELTVINFRDRAACGRNLAVEILEYFDAARYTRRAGEHRVIIDKEFIEKM